MTFTHSYCPITFLISALLAPALASTREGRKMKIIGLLSAFRWPKSRRWHYRQWMCLPSLPGQQQAELGPAEVQGWSQESNCLPTDLNFGEIKQLVPQEKRRHTTSNFKSFLRNWVVFFVENVGIHFIFHLFGLVFFLGSCSSECPLCLLLSPLVSSNGKLLWTLGQDGDSKYLQMIILFSGAGRSSVFQHTVSANNFMLHVQYSHKKKGGIIVFSAVCGICLID